MTIFLETLKSLLHSLTSTRPNRFQPSNPNRRIVLTLVLSLLLHGLILWLPEIHLPPKEIKLPPLTAKLEPLPKATAKISPSKPKPKIRPKPQPEPVIQALPDLPIAPSAPIAASAPEPVSAPVVAEAEPAPPRIPVASEVPPTEPPRPPLPKHARLHFDVYFGKGRIKIGEALHTLEISDGRYILQSDVRTTGIASMLKSYHMVQISSGSATQNTLRPDTFSEEITDSNGKQTNRADFNWANNTVYFSMGGEAKLNPSAQDILSILYQFPAMKRQIEIISIYIGTGKKYEEYRFEIAFSEPLETPLGTMQTIHFRKLHAEHEEGLEIWFAQEYRLLPVKMRHLDGSGNVAGEAIITDIGVAE